MAARVRKGDTVQVITGSDKGKQGKVLSVSPKENRAVVDGINIAMRHTKPSGMGKEGGIIPKAMPIHLSNLALVDPASGKPTKVSFRVLETGAKIRVARATGNAIEG
jgi:large subunit ribosomal protein L24